MKPEDLACFNCAGSLVKEVRQVERGEISALSWGLVVCRQRLSEHYKHLVELTHVCAWHSDYVSQDTRYPFWKETIDLPVESD